MREKDDQNPGKYLDNVNDPKNRIYKHSRNFLGMGDQEPDVNNHIYEEHYLASDDDNGIEDFDFPDNDTLYNDGFQTGERSNPNLGQPHVTHEDTKFNIHFSEGQPHVTHDYVSPGGTLYWTPIVLDDIKPKVSSKFNSYGEVETMYRNYALESGFDVRLGRVQKTKNGIITNRHLVCNREERHNHELFSKGNMHLSRSKRKLDYSQEIFIHNLSKQNIGPVKAHRLYSALQVGPSVQGGLVTDFKNARRILNCYIGGRDAKFLVDKMNDRKKNVPSFTFEYKVLNKRLHSLFWADETAKYNYNSFGDVVSLDATFSMNKYDMVFLPFTGIDNHKKCVTFGAGLLSKEDGVSYEWLLRAFLKAFRKQPQLVLSDQDPTLKKAIDKVFPLAHHRLCMWHITKKLPNKVQKEISRAEDNCFQKNVICSNGVDTIIVLEKTMNITIRQTNDVDVDDKDEEYNYDCLIRDAEYTVTHSTEDGSFKCICMHFEHVGILCRHIFCVFKFYGIEQIPEKYILKRWRRDVIPTELLKRRFTNSFEDSNSDMTAIDIFSTIDRCVSFLSHDATKLKLYLDDQNKLKKKFVDDCPNHDLPTRVDHFKKLLGVVGPDVESDVNDIQNPIDIRNKCCSSRGKRLKSTKEMIEKESTKPKRECATCEQMVHHDKRNCPLKNAQK
uniref:SWIM-type domain-containing protein n=1 Tax=Lactuca sativa TaxID=4236 RepID=A0A9R1VNV2_LACSA|nr:hypothetical protein LSAT_V11C400201630 [Lactuca sativa]